MATPRVMRYSSPDDLADGLAHRLVHAIVRRQDDQQRIDLCVAGGRIATRVYEALGRVPERQAVDPAKLHVWWGDDAFVPTGSPERNSQRTLPLLTAAFHLDPSRTHLMPTADGKADPDEAAYAYAQELGETTFDLCLLGVGPDGEVASLHPDRPSFSPETSALAVGVTDFPVPPAERISLTLPEFNRSRQLWLVASGAEKAQALAEALCGSVRSPAALAHGTEETCWWTGQEAAAGLPSYNCSL